MNTPQQFVTLGGRRYRMLEIGTLEHVLWIDQINAEIGLNRLLLAPVEDTPAAAGEFVGRIWEQIAKSGRTFDYLGGTLVPEELKDEEWTPAIALELAARFKKLTDPADHARVRPLLIALVTGFFEAALPWRKLSGIVSASEAAGPAEARKEWTASASFGISAPGAT